MNYTDSPEDPTLTPIQELREARSNRGLFIFIAILLSLQLCVSVYTAYQNAAADKSARFDRHNPGLFR